jgi:hypothetical protein
MRRIFCARYRPHWCALSYHRIRITSGASATQSTVWEGSEGALLLAEVSKREASQQADNNKHAGQLLFAFDSFRHHGVHHHGEKSSRSYGTQGSNDLRGSTTQESRSRAAAKSERTVIVPQRPKI